MPRIISATWAAANLLFGLLLTFLAPRFSTSIAWPILIGYSLLLPSALLIASRRAKQGADDRFGYFIPAALLAAAFAIYGVTTGDIQIRFIILGWAAVSALAFMTNLISDKTKKSEKRDEGFLVLASIALAAAELISGSELRAVLGWLSAYLLISGVFLAVLAASDAK